MKENNNSFRDRPINMNKEGGRKWIYAKKPIGKWYKWRTIVSWIWLTIFVVAPLIKVNGHPFMLIDIVNRKFIIFGIIFWAQDTVILALLMLSFVFFIILFTVTYGRIWCGWACPQTIFLEMVYRKIEYLIDGNYRKSKRSKSNSINFWGIIKVPLKHAIFIIISIIITNVFLMWFIGPEGLLELFSDPISEHTTGFVVMLVISGIFYWIYSFFREQICTMVCPYGRMQGVLLDSKSIIVAYDYKRGEPRGHKNEGDCIDCKQCIAVCPTGIDIRNGTQLECINCTACIDECNIVMEKIKKPKNLIRFDSIEGIEKGHKSIWNVRNKAYSVVLLVLIGFFIFTLFTRPVIETTILRTPGTLFQKQSENSLSNIYNIKIINKTYDDIPLNIKIESHEGKIEMAGGDIIVKKHGLYESVFVLTLDQNQLSGEKTEVTFGIYSNDELLETYELTFIGPIKNKYQ